MMFSEEKPNVWIAHLGTFDASIYMMGNGKFVAEVNGRYLGTYDKYRDAEKAAIAAAIDTAYNTLETVSHYEIR